MHLASKKSRRAIARSSGSEPSVRGNLEWWGLFRWPRFYSSHQLVRIYIILSISDFLNPVFSFRCLDYSSGSLLGSSTKFLNSLYISLFTLHSSFRQGADLPKSIFGAQRVTPMASCSISSKFFVYIFTCATVFISPGRLYFSIECAKSSRLESLTHNWLEIPDKSDFPGVYIVP